MAHKPSPQEIAERTVAAMMDRDRLAAAHGIEVVSTAPGAVTVRMTVQEHMLNGHGICHGGALFVLADTAFALACNNRNQNMLANVCSISYLRPAALGEELTATAQETAHEGRTGIFDITVTNAEGRAVAIFRGQARSVPGHLIPELADRKEP